MDGFNVIPRDGVASVDIPRTQEDRPTGVGLELQPPSPSSKVTVEKSKFDLVFWVAVLGVLSVIGYLSYLVAMRFVLLSRIQGISQELVQLQSTFNKSDISDLKTVDQRLKIINSRLGSHVLTATVFDTVNQHIRTATQLSEYKISISENNVDVTLSAIAPSFKEMAEQTERLFVMKDQNLIKSFSITNLAYEQDTHKVRFTIKMILDKSRYSALGMRQTN